MSFDRTRYQREYARRRRHAAWVAKAGGVDRCPAMLGNRKPCRWVLTNRVVDGVTVPFCAQCDRKARGICIDCQRARVRGTVGKALRCAGCGKLERGAAERRWRERHPGTVRRQWRRRKQRLMQNPAAYRASLERKRLWRLASPTAKRRYAEQWGRTETAQAYQRAYRERNRARISARERERYRLYAQGVRPTHPCARCGVPVAGRAKKCDACRRDQYQTARQALSGGRAA